VPLWHRLIEAYICALPDTMTEPRVTQMTDIAQQESQAAHWLAAFGAGHVVVLGDVMLDRYVSGDVRRISPEAPIPVLRADQRRSVLGGAGNVAANIASLGATASLIGLIGRDAAAEECTAMLSALPSIIAQLVRSEARPTTVKTRFMSGNHQLLRLDEEVTEALDIALEDAVLDAFTAALPGAGAVVLSDYHKGVLTDRVLRTAIDAAAAAGVPVIADPKRPDLTCYRGVSVLTPNVLEVTAATGIAALTDTAAAAAGTRALAQSGAGAVLVTRSERGMTLVRPGEAPLHVPARARGVADVSGAGDTMAATLAIALACGAALPEAAALANAAAGIAVTKPGTATVSHAELAAVLHRHEWMAIDEKIADLDAGLARIAAWRREGLQVGFTNGCFDLIHPGHVRLLARARASCDRLVVALNSDASVRRLKGADRPVQNETARATVMASMASADLVMLFEEDTPERLIRAILPDVLIKGADYTVAQVVGADIVEAAGGRVALIPLEAGHSTTNTIRRINAAP
jgi:D-beta-D-heptose 7-phosphate kinase/D-beta-D-heptose 1-phosphate adenosyltransferase